MVVKLVACLDGCVVDFGRYAARVRECLSGVFGEAELFGGSGDFLGCFSAGFAFSAANGNAVFFW